MFAQVADRIKKHIMPRSVPRLLPPDVEENVKNWASSVEGLVDKVVSGESCRARPPCLACRRARRGGEMGTVVAQARRGRRHRAGAPAHTEGATRSLRFGCCLERLVPGEGLQRLPDHMAH